MSLPERRKSAEELAALRESLGIPGDAPAEGAPGAGPRPNAPVEKDTAKAKAAGALESTVFEAAPVDESDPAAELPKLKQVHSLRRSERVAIPQTKSRTKVEGGKIPVRRHSEKELSQLKRTQAPASEPPAVHLQKLAAGPLQLLALYLIGILLIVTSMLGAKAATMNSMDLPWEWLGDASKHPNYLMSAYGIMLAGASVLLIGALWIQLRKVRSRHHAAFMTIIAVLVLVFGTLYFFPNLHGA